MTTATSLNELQQQIRDRYDSLSKRLQQVSRYVLDNTNSVAFDTVAVIAERADVPPSTLIRFANAFDFTGFNEMKQLFRMNLVEETASYSDRARLFREMESQAVPETPARYSAGVRPFKCAGPPAVGRPRRAGDAGARRAVAGRRRHNLYRRVTPLV